MKYIIYARISPRGSSYDGENSIQMQIDYCRDYVAKKGDGSTVVDAKYDELISGKNLNRPAIKEIIDELKSGTAKWDCLCVYNLSRLTRNPRDMYEVMDLLSKHKKLFISSSEPEFDFSTLAGEMLMGIISHTNQYLRKISGKNTKDKMVSIAKSGGWPAGNPPFGYRRGAPKNNTLLLDPVNSVVLRDIFEMYASENYTLRDIIRKHNGIISKSRICELLTNPTCLGKIVYDGQIYDGKHEPIIDNELFLRVQDKRPKKETNLRIKAYKFPFLLAGIVFCHCGRRLSPATAKSGQYAYYCCTDAECKTRVSAQRIDDEAINALQGIKLNKNVVRATVEEIQKRNTEKYVELKPDITKYQSEKGNLLREKEKLFLLLIDGILSQSIKAMANEKINTIDKKISILDVKIANIQKFNIPEEKYYLAAAEYINNFEKFSEMLKSAKNTDNLRKILSTFIQEVRLLGGGAFEIKLRYELESSNKLIEWYPMSELFELITFFFSIAA